MHEYNDCDKCIYCGSTRLMIEKHNWKCNEDMIPQDRIVNEKVYNEIAKKDADVKLSKDLEPWRRIIFKVYHTDAGVTGLDQDEYDYYVLNSLCGEVYNGGLEQYFGNSGGNEFNGLMAALQKYGHTELFNRIKSISEKVFGDVDVESREVRTELLYGDSQKTDDPVWEEFSHEEMAVLDADMDRLYKTIAAKNGYKIA